MSNICVLITTPPSPDPEVAEMILALAAFDHKVSVICSGAGTGWLYQHQGPRKSAGKSPDKVVSAFSMYDVDDVFFRTSDPVGGDLIPSARALTDEEITRLIAAADYCLSF